MKDQLKAYLDNAFAKAEPNQKNKELKEEILSNLIEKYDDCLARGMSEETAYRTTVSGVGDLSALFHHEEPKKETAPQLIPLFSDREQKKRYLLYNIGLPCAIMLYIFSIFPIILWQNSVWAVIAMLGCVALATGAIIYLTASKPILVSAELKEPDLIKLRKQYSLSASLLALPVMLYILCICPVILLEAYEKLGILLMFTVIALATGCLIVRANTLSKERLLKERHGQSASMNSIDEEPLVKTRTKNIFSVLSGIYWAIICLIYFIISFVTGRWELSWLIFLCGGLIFGIANGVSQLIVGKHRAGSIVKIVICSILLFALISPRLIFMDNDVSLRFNSSSLRYDDSDYKSGSFSLSENDVVKDLNIDWIEGSVTVCYWEESYVSVCETSAEPLTNHLQYRFYGTELDIKFEKSKVYWFGDIQAKDLTVYLPQATELQDLSVSNVSGPITVSDGIYREIDLETVSGQIHCSGSARDIDIDTVSGDIELTISNTPSSINIDSVSADTTLAFREAIEGFFVEMDSVSGNLYWDDSVSHEHLVGTHYKNGKTDVNFDSVSGSLTIRIDT